MTEFIKLFLLVAFSSLLIYENSWQVTVAGFFSILIISFFATGKTLKSRAVVLIYISVFIIVFNLFLNQAAKLSDRLFLGLTAALRLAALSLAVLVFTSTTSTRRLLKLFSFLPPNYRLALSIFFGTIPSILSEWQTIRTVQNSRAYTGKLFHFKRGFLPLLIPLFHRAMKRGEQLALTVTSRGFDAG